MKRFKIEHVIFLLWCLLFIAGCVTVYKATDNASIETHPELMLEDDDTIDLFNHKKDTL